MKRKRLIGWGLAFAGMALLVVLAPAPPPAGRDGDVVQNAARPAAAAPPRPARGPADSEVLPLVARVAEARQADGRLWQPRGAPVAPPSPRMPPPPPPPLAGLEATVPAAPPLPFRMLGRYADGAKEGVILQGPDGAVLIAHPGETLGDNYRVESVAGNILVLSYLPLMLRQTMDIGITR